MTRLKKNDRLNKIAIDLMTELVELKQKQYYRRQGEMQDKYKIDELEGALLEMKIPLPGDWTPNTEYIDYGDDD